MAKKDLLGITEIYEVVFRTSPDKIQIDTKRIEVDEKPKQLWVKPNPNSSYTYAARYDKSDLGRIRFGHTGDSVYSIYRSAICLPNDVQRVKKQMHADIVSQLEHLLEAGYEMKDQLMNSDEVRRNELLEESL